MKAVLNGRERFFLAALLGALFFQEFCSMRLLTASNDETMHLPSGYTYWKTGDFRLNPEHPPLIKLLCSAPLLLIHPIVRWDDPSWSHKPADEVLFGMRFLYSNDADQLLFWGRLPIVLLSVLLGVFLFRWARELYGTPGAFFALVLYAFCPTILAHSRFVTMDLGLSCFFLITLYYLWRFATRGGVGEVIASGIALGLALATKFSAVILIPVIPIVLGAVALAGPAGTSPDAPATLEGFPAARGRGRRLWIGLKAYVLLTGVAFTLVWAIYFFPRNPLFYLEGMTHVAENHAPGYQAYLMGNFSEGGWWYYFLAALLLKTPVPTLIALLLSMILVKGPLRRWRDESFIVIPAVCFLMFTSVLANDVGIRYVLPVLPLAFVFAGRAANPLLRRPIGRAAAWVLAVWLAAGTLLVYPDDIAYFSDIVGGPSNGWKYMDDSNIDWGTDLKRLKDYMDEHGIQKIRFYSPWNGSPRYYGLNFEWYSFGTPQKPPPGIYAIATHSLIRGLLMAKVVGYHTDWLTRYKPVGRVGYGFYIFKFD